MKKLFVACTLLWTINSEAQTFTFTEFKLTPDVLGSGPGNFHILNGKLIFTGSDTALGNELWVTDGTQTGTQRLKDINFGKYGSGSSYFTFFNNKLYFTSVDTSIGREVWYTDGTDTGTRLLKDINVGKSNAEPQQKIIFNGKLIFAAIDSNAGYELWISDGTTAGTYMLKDIYPGKDDGYPYNFVEFNNKIYFVATTANGKELWCTDGTVNGTQQVNGVFTGNSIHLVGSWNGKLFMLQYTSASNQEIWVTDGTAAGTQMLIEVVPGPNFGTQMFYMTEYKGKLLFMAYTPFAIGKSYLYTTDGTPAGTNLLQSFPSNGLSGFYPNFCEYDGKLFFIGSRGNGFSNATPTLWVTDGTAAGTKEMINQGTAAPVSHPLALVVYNDYLYFTATIQGGSRQVVRSDGSDTGFIVPPPPSTQINPLGPGAELIVYDSALYFGASYLSYGEELWRLKDTTTRRIVTPPPGNVATTVGKTELTIYPNPNTGKFTVAFDDVPLSEGMLVVYDIAGRVVFDSRVTPGRNRMDIALEHVPAGLYYVKMTSGDLAGTGVIHISTY